MNKKAEQTANLLVVFKIGDTVRISQRVLKRVAKYRKRYFNIRPDKMISLGSAVGSIVSLEKWDEKGAHRKMDGALVKFTTSYGIWWLPLTAIELVYDEQEV